MGSLFDVERMLVSFFVNAMFKYQGLSVMAEYADKRSVGVPVVSYDEEGFVYDSFEVGTGLNVQAGYLFGHNMEIAGRFTTIEPNAVTSRVV